MTEILIPIIRICTKCKKHGHIKFPGAAYSLEFCFIAQGLKFLNDEIKNGNVMQQDINDLVSQIMTCGLPNNHDKVPEKLLWTLQLWNDNHSECRSYNMYVQYTAHEDTQTHPSLIEIPGDIRQFLDREYERIETN